MSRLFRRTIVGLGVALLLVANLWTLSEDARAFAPIDDETAGGDGPKQRKAARLIRTLYASEAWIDAVESILIRSRREQTSLSKDRPDYSQTILSRNDRRRQWNVSRRRQ